MINLKNYIIEGIFDIDDNEEKLDRTINIYKNAINIIKHHVFHPNTLTSFCMEMDSNSTDDDIINYLKQTEDYKYFDLFKVLHEISSDIDWYKTFNTVFSINDIAEKEFVQLLTLPLGTGEKANLTIASASMALVNNYKAVNGDFVTLVGVKSRVKTLTEDPINAPEWHIMQFVVDTTNTGKLIEYLEKQDEDASTFFSTDGRDPANIVFSYSNDGCAWLGIILSRVTANGVKVSTSNLMPNYYAYEIYKKSLELPYRQSALNSWGRSSEAILKGGIAKSTNI